MREGVPNEADVGQELPRFVGDPRALEDPLKYTVGMRQPTVSATPPPPKAEPKQRWRAKHAAAKRRPASAAAASS
jgi:hypothetical protein